MNGFVFIDGWGLVRFKCTEIIEVQKDLNVYSGKVKYPTGWVSPNLKKWDDYDFDFEEDMIFSSVLEAAQSVINMNQSLIPKNENQ